jgi:hypothetical protein
MPAFQIDLDGQNAWPDLATREVVQGAWTRLSALPAGMQSGALSIAIVVELPDGRPVCAETSWRLLHAACAAIAARYGAPGTEFLGGV